MIDDQNSKIICVETVGIKSFIAVGGKSDTLLSIKQAKSKLRVGEYSGGEWLVP